MTNAPLCLPALSCAFQMIPNIDGCCMNNPGGYFLQTQFWDASPPLGGNETWTIHGLWPDLCTGGFEQYCNSTRNKSPEEITQILSSASTSDTRHASHPGLLEYITKHWLSLDSRNANLWAHEFNKHGTCISTLQPQCYDRDQSKPNPPPQFDDGDVLDYFTQTVLLYTTLPTFEFFARHGIVPSHEETYELEHLKRAIRDSSHGTEPTIRCRNHNELSEIWYHFNVRAELRNAMELWWGGNKQWNSWVPTNPLRQVSNCPETGIRYLPKDIREPSPPTPTQTTQTETHTATHTAGPTQHPFTGKGRLMVKVATEDGLNSAGDDLDQSHHIESQVSFVPVPPEYTGCLIRKGTWYAARSLSSCATFTAHDDVKSELLPLPLDNNDDDPNYHLFTLASRFAPCSFVRIDESASTHSSEAQAVLDQPDKNESGTYFACSQNLPFQTILSNNATVDKQHSDAGRRMMLGEEHQYVFFAEKVPRRNEQTRIWDDDGDGERGVKVEIYWEGV